MAKTKHKQKKAEAGQSKPSRNFYIALGVTVAISIIVGVLVGMFVFARDRILGPSTSANKKLEMVNYGNDGDINTYQFSNPVTQSFVATVTPPTNDIYPLTGASVTFPTGSFTTVSNVTLNSVKTQLMNYPCTASLSGFSNSGFNLNISSCAGVLRQILGTNVGLGQSSYYFFKDQIYVVAFGNYPAVVYRGALNAYYVCVSLDTSGRTWGAPVQLSTLAVPSSSISSCAAVMTNGQPMLAIATASQVPSAGVAANAIEIILSSSGTSFSAYSQYTLTASYNALLQPGMTLNLVNGLPVLNAYVSNFSINSSTNATTGQFLCFAATSNYPLNASAWTSLNGISLGSLPANQIYSTLNTFGYITSLQSSSTSVSFSTNPFQAITNSNGFTVATATLAFAPPMNTPLRLGFLNTLPVAFYMKAGTSQYNSVTSANVFYNVATSYALNTYSTGTVAQSTTTVTGLGTTFTSNMVGGGLVFASGGNPVIITAVNSATSLTVSPSQSVSAGTSFTITYFPTTMLLANELRLDSSSSQLAYEVATLSSGNVGIAYINTNQTLNYALLRSSGITLSPLGNMTYLSSAVGLSVVNNIPYVAFGYGNHPFAQITNTGTVAQTSGSLTITGTGTNFTSALIGQSLFVMKGSSGDVYPCGVITAVASTTSMTVTMTYTGISGSYVIYPFYNVVYTSSSDNISQSTTTITQNNASTLLTYPVIGCQIFVNHTSNATYDGVIQSVTNSTTMVTDTSASYSNVPFTVLSLPSLAFVYAGTAAQSNYTVTGTNTQWTSALQGMAMYYLSGVFAGTVVAVLSSTSLIVSNPLTIANTFYTIFPMSSAVNVVGAGSSTNDSFLDFPIVSYSATGQ